MARVREAIAYRVALADAGGLGADEVKAALAARGIAAEPASLERALDVTPGAIAFAPAEAPTARVAADLAPMCARAAAAGRPVVLLASYPRCRGKAAVERAAALAYLRAHGAVLCSDPDVWLETLVLLTRFGIPDGPRVAVVAPPGSWLWSSALALEAEAAAAGRRSPAPAGEIDRTRPADAVLIDRGEQPPADKAGKWLAVPVVGRAELLGAGSAPALVGLRAAVAAIAAAGRFAERRAAGLGAAAPGSADRLDPDHDRFQRQLDKLGRRAGDHETKVLLASYGVAVTRQAVATTASAATRIAKKAGWPVEVKPWGSDVASERGGCPVERGLTSAAEVRRAFAAVASAGKLPPGSPVIVRETPPPGRELSVRIERLGALAWTVIVDLPGVPEPMAAPAPVRAVDAQAIARRLDASRFGEPPPDRDSLADLLVRASHMAVCHEDVIESLELSRVVAQSRGAPAVVVDARAELKR